MANGRAHISVLTLHTRDVRGTACSVVPQDPLESILGIPEPLQTWRRTAKITSLRQRYVAPREAAVGVHWPISSRQHHDKLTGHFAKFFSVSRLRTVLQSAKDAASEPSVASRV